MVRYVVSPTGADWLEPMEMTQELPPRLRDLPIEVLPLPRRTLSALRRGHLLTVGELAEVWARGELGAVPGIGSASLAAIDAVLGQNRESAGPASDAGSGWGSLLEQALTPAVELEPGEDPPDLVRLIGPLSKRVLEVYTTGSAVDHYTVIRCRFGLEGSRRYVFQDIADAYGLTRQRIHQLQVRAMEHLRQAVLGQEAVPGRLIPGPIVAEARRLQKLLHSRGPVWRDDQLVAFLADRYHRPIEGEAMGSLSLLMGVLGFVRSRTDPSFQAGDWYWHPAAGPEFAPKELRRAARAVYRAFRAHSEPLSLVDLRIAVNRRRSQRIDERYISYALRLNRALEPVGDDVFRVRFEHLSSHGRRAYRVLREHGQPMRLREIVGEINRRLVAVGREAVSLRSVQQQVVEDQRIVFIGRGQWALKEWNHPVLVPTGQLLRDYFLVRQEKATLDEIMEFVVQHRPDLNRNAVYWCLCSNRHFRRVSATEWQLAQWGGPEYVTPARLSRREWADHILAAARELQATHESPVPAAALVANLSKRTGRTPSTCYSVLSRCPLVRLAGPRMARTAELAVTAPEEIAQLVEQWAGRRQTIRSRVREAVTEFLSAQEGQAAPLRQVVAYVEQKVACPRASVYGYISEMDNLEKVRQGRQTMAILRSG